MEITLNEIETLADKLLADRAQRLRSEIQEMQTAHQTDVAALLDSIAARAGVEIPASARRETKPDGSVVIVWTDEPAPETPPSA